MRVLSVGNLYPPHHLGGYELIWRSSVHHLRAAGHRVRVLTTEHAVADPDPGIAADADVHRELRWYWRDHAFPRHSFRRRLAIERHNLAVLDCHLTELRPHAVIWWAMGGMSMSLLARARERRVPALGAVHDQWLSYGPAVDGWQRAFARPALAPLARRLAGVPTPVDLGGAARWLFVSAWLRDRALELGLDVAAAPVIHSGIELDRFPAQPVAEWEGRLLCLGRIDPRKGIATVISALPLLPAASLRCVGGGDPEHLAALRAQAAELGVADRVGFETMPRDRIASAYAQADALAFCVDWAEPFGLVPLEAMASGRPVIATATGGSAEYLRDGENCLAVAPGDPAGLAAAVERLGADERLRARLRAGGLETAPRHTEAIFNRALEAELEELVR